LIYDDRSASPQANTLQKKKKKKKKEKEKEVKSMELFSDELYEHMQPSL